MLNQFSTNELPEQDIQCQRILDGLKSLENIISPGKVGETILEVGEKGKAESQENAQKLIRLSRTVEQYANRSQDLFYIGIMGHFSAGKSSTINSVLGLWGQKNARNVGLNPTDKIITLLTSPNNLQNLIGVAYEGKVSIRCMGVENRFLEKLVLADTPGSGDPSLQNAMIRDFMPVCDLILYFISAAIPLDEADLPLLKKKHEKLPFIPLKFVITRADEFKLDNDQALSEENFDQRKVGEFKIELLSRIREVLKESNLTDKDLFLIDNKSEFRTQILINYLTELTNTQNIQVATSIHSHKIDYFRNSANEIKSYFLNFVCQKIDVLSKLVDTANKNRKDYNDEVKISNSKMTENWFRHLSILQYESKYFVEEINNLKKQLGLIDNFVDEKQLLEWKQKQDELINAYSEIPSERIYDAIRNVALEQIESWYKKIQKYFDLLGKRDFNITGYELTINDSLFFNKLSSLKLSVPITVKEEILTLERLVNKLIKDLEQNLQNSLSDVEKIITENQVIERYDEVIDVARESLEKDIESYFRVVKVYLTAVFSLQVRDYISSLGIGQDLDNLAIDITEEDKSHKKREVIEKIFPEYQNHNFQFKKKCGDIKEETMSFIKELTALKNQKLEQRLARTSDLEDYFSSCEKERREWFKYDKTIIDLVNDSISEANKIVKQLEKEVYASSKRLGDEIAKIQKNRQQKIIKSTVIGGLIPVVIYILFQFLQAADQSIGKQIIVGIGINIISSLICYLWTTENIRIERDEKQARKNNIRYLNQTYRDRVESVLHMDNDKVNKSSNIKDALTREWSHRVSTLDKCDFMIQKQEEYENLKKNYQRFSKICQKYTSSLNDFSSKYCAYFSDSDNNLKVLNEIADEIKQSAITPSFDMLTSIEKVLDALKQEVENIKYS